MLRPPSFFGSAEQVLRRRGRSHRLQMRLEEAFQTWRFEFAKSVYFRRVPPLEQLVKLDPLCDTRVFVGYRANSGAHTVARRQRGPQDEQPHEEAVEKWCKNEDMGEPLPQTDEMERSRSVHEWTKKWMSFLHVRLGGCGVVGSWLSRWVESSLCILRGAQQVSRLVCVNSVAFYCS